VVEDLEYLSSIVRWQNDSGFLPIEVLLFYARYLTEKSNSEEKKENEKGCFQLSGEQI
jgi:hypothetical protein